MAFFIVVSIGAFLSSMIVISISSVKEAQSREGIILSPNNKKSIEFISSKDRTQVLANFHKLFFIGGGNVVVINTKPDNIQIEWIDNDNLKVRCPKDSSIEFKNDVVSFFNESINIIYEEY